jgi:3-phosphoshikimate 1-carboxyvinyltransferase
MELRVPGDKSISHRALMLSALAEGRAMITGMLNSADTRSTAAVLRTLGVAVPDIASDVVSFDGVGLRGLRAPAATLDCGNSGTTARLMMGIAAAQSFTTRFDGDESLRGRPMRRVTQPLTEMGASVKELGHPDRLPLELRGGKLQPIRFVNEKSSGQVKSAVLLAALCGGAGSVVTEPVHSRDHTERLLDAMGVSVRTVVDGGAMQIEIEPTDRLRAMAIEVPGDFSSAAFFLARGLLAHPPVRIVNVGVNATRTGFLDVVRKMQGTIHIEERRTSCNEPIGTLVAERCELRGVQIEAAEIPHMVDEVPIVAVMASQAHGETVIRGAGELRVKETDRLRALANNLRTVGARVEELQDGLAISGSDRPLRGRIKTYGDHRIAMAFGILGSLSGNEIDMDDAACVDVSFPTFWQQLGECTR